MLQTHVRQILLVQGLASLHVYFVLTETLVNTLSVLLAQHHDARHLVRLLEQVELADGVGEVQHDLAVELAVTLADALDHQFGHHLVFQLLAFLHRGLGERG